MTKVERQRIKIEALLLHLNDCKDSISDDDARPKAEAAVRKTAEFIELFERSTGASIPIADRAPLGTHLWKAHVDTDTCSNCPYFALLAPWRSLVSTSSLWIAWAAREREKPGKRAIWSAHKTLSVYLSLQADGLRSGTEFKLGESNGRKQLTDGNNRVRILAAMGKRDFEVTVIEACSPTRA